MADLTSMLASLQNNPQALQMLLSAGANIGAQGRQGSAIQGISQGLTGAIDQYQKMQQQQAAQQYMASQQKAMEGNQQRQAAADEQEKQFAANLRNPDFLAKLPPQVQQFVQAGADPKTVMQMIGQQNSLEQRDQALAQQNSLAQQRMEMTGQMQAQQAGMATDRLELQRQRLQMQQQYGAGGGNVGKMPAVTDIALPDGRVQKMRYDPATGDYAPWGAPERKRALTLEEQANADAEQATAPGMGAPTVSAAVEQLTRQPQDNADQNYVNGGAVPTPAPKPAMPAPVLAPQQSAAPLQGPRGGFLGQMDQLAQPMAAPQGGPRGGGINPQSQSQAYQVPSAGPRGGGIITPQAAQASGGPAAPKSKAEYDLLPVGTQYIDPQSGALVTKGK